MTFATKKEYEEFIEGYNQNCGYMEDFGIRRISPLKRVFCTEGNCKYTTLSYTVTYDHKWAWSNRYSSQKHTIKVKGHIK